MTAFRIEVGWNNLYFTNFNSFFFKNAGIHI